MLIQGRIQNFSRGNNPDRIGEENFILQNLPAQNYIETYL